MRLQQIIHTICCQTRPGSPSTECFGICKERYWKDRNREIYCVVCVGLCVLPDALTCGYAVDTNPRLEAIYQSQGAV